MDTKKSDKWVSWLVGIIVLSAIFQYVLPWVGHGLGNLSALSAVNGSLEGAPLIGLFARNGLVMLIVMAGIAIFYLKSAKTSTR